MVHFASLARAISLRYAFAMPKKPPNLADALLRLWLLAELAMAGLYVWQGWLLLPYPGDWAAPPTRRAVTVVEGLFLFLLIPALIVIAARWRATRDRQLRMLAFTYCVALVWSSTASAMADTLGAVRALFYGEALIALLAVPIALRAIRVSA